MNIKSFNISSSSRPARAIFSCDVLQYSNNDHTNRMKLIVTKSLLILQKKNILMRQIKIDEIEAFTWSLECNEVVVHCLYEEDERLEMGLNNFALIRTLLYLRTKSLKQGYVDKKLIMYLVNDVNLSIFLTTADDIDERRKIRPDACYGEDLDYFKFINTYCLSEIRNNNNSKNKISKEGKTPISSINDFEYLKVLGKGAHGKVLLVREKYSNILLAMKILKKQHVVESKQLEHTVSEKSILTKIRHPFIVSLYKSFHTDDKIYFCMEFVKGGELFQHLRKLKQFTEDQTKFIVACLVLALGHLHDRGYIYRDLKPENILLDEEGYCKLTDFGFSKSIGIDDLAKTFCGTPEYMPPEVILDKGCAYSGDWWSLGILTYEMIYGIPPFYNTNTQKMYKNTLLKPLKFKKYTHCSQEAQDFLAGLLVKDPKKRLGSFADVNEIMSHPWFKNFDWIALENRNFLPPFKPLAQVDSWEENFDPDFMIMKPTDSVCITNKSIIEPFAETFADFDYVNEDFTNEMSVNNIDLSDLELASHFSESTLTNCKENILSTLKLDQRFDSQFPKDFNNSNTALKGFSTCADTQVSSNMY